MTERKELILEYLIVEYVKTAQPVSSFVLQKEYNLPYSSATIRSELAELEEEGFLVQIHTSSGRVPSDKGYRYYVNRLLGRQEILKQYIKKTHNILDEFSRIQEIHIKLKHLLTQISSESGNVTIGKLSSNVVFEEGTHKFLSQPYFSSMDFIKEALDDLDSIKQNMDEIGKDLPKGNYQLYIGDENPVQSMKKYSVIVGKCTIDQDDGIIVMIGPKSMEYAKNIALIEYVLNPNNYNEDE